MLNSTMMVGPVFVVLIIQLQLQGDRNRSDLKLIIILGIECPVYLSIAILFIAFTDTILNHMLLVGHSETDCQSPRSCMLLCIASSCCLPKNRYM